MSKRPAFHRLFHDKTLKANVEYRRVYEEDDDDTRHILDAAQADIKDQGITWDQYIGKENAYGSEILDWYANGPKIPKDRTGLVAMLHPQFHKRGWDGIAETATQIAKELRRWVWVCEAQESRWYLIMIGDAPGEDAEGERTWKKHVKSRDQHIAVIDPKGEWRLLGAS